MQHQWARRAIAIASDLSHGVWLNSMCSQNWLSHPECHDSFFFVSTIHRALPFHRWFVDSNDGLPYIECSTRAARMLGIYARSLLLCFGASRKSFFFWAVLCCRCWFIFFFFVNRFVFNTSIYIFYLIECTIFHTRWNEWALTNEYMESFGVDTFVTN